MLHLFNTNWSIKVWDGIVANIVKRGVLEIEVSFSTYLQGHKAPVIKTAWSADSIHLASTDADGRIYCWFMDEFYGYAEILSKGSNYTSILYDPTRLFIYACGPNIPLRAFETDKKVASRQVLPEMFSNAEFSVDADKSIVSNEDEPVGASLALNRFRLTMQPMTSPS